ncbi:tyrosine-protein phosphatase [Tannockella kyphosi]|uniref:tyrosine-protein phosphatase n=1 Tax=Tannockella kyphosi TaxID=2899121 RepID=UPI0020127316|nr:tyrosine-protein phosphatase [Tannockella kyphosi]
MQLSREERYIKLTGMPNTRDLGGYETQGGRYTRSNCFVRASSMAGAKEEDMDILRKKEVEIIIDLRSPNERHHQPSKAYDEPSFQVYEIPLLQDKFVHTLPEDIKNFQDLSGFYIYLLEANKENIRKIFEVFVKHSYQTILFHCSAGKDRSGVISALLLDLAGCYEYDIVKDYSQSYENNQKMMESLEQVMDLEDKKFLSSNPRYMMKFLGYLKENYGSAKGYLLSCGIKEEDIEIIIENFTI